MDGNFCRILIADDNKDIHEDIKYILEASSANMEDYQETRLLKEELFGSETGLDKKEPMDINYRIDDAYQGEEAVKMVEAAKNTGDPYSLIFMDVRMPPGIDGIQAIERIWKIDPDVGVVICTAYSDYSWDQIISKFGQNDNLLFIRKPFDSVSLKQIALAMTTKWSLKIQVDEYIENLEKQVDKRTSELTVMVDKLKAEIKLRKEKEKQLAHSAHYDSLTSLLNRRSFYYALSAITGEEPYYRSEFSLFYIDIDDFKMVNDEFGHDTGDQLLVEVADRIKHILDPHTCKITDFITENGNVEAIFRLGGDEFTALIEEKDREKTGTIAQNLIDCISQPYRINGHMIQKSCCVGIGIYPQSSQTTDHLLKCADIALYEAKKVNGVYRFYSGTESL